MRPGRPVLIGLPAEGDETGLVGYRTVERDPVDLVVRRLAADLGHDDLHLERLELVGEDGPERLRVPVGQAARGHVLPVVLVAGYVRVSHAGLPQDLVLVVAADGGEAVLERLVGWAEPGGQAADSLPAADPEPVREAEALARLPVLATMQVGARCPQRLRTRKG